MNAIITGSGRECGIGATIAYSLAELGYNVYLTSCIEYDKHMGIITDAVKAHDHDYYERIIQKCCSYGVQTEFRCFDFRDEYSYKELFDDANSKLGNIDVLVTSHCVHMFDSLGKISPTRLNLNYTVNAMSVFLICQEFYKRFKGSYGRIINLSSTQNLEPLVNEISYAISKASIPVIVSTLAPIMANKGITINAVNPGATEIGDVSDKTLNHYKKCNSFGRIGDPEDVSNLVQFLVSDKGGWITGQTINSEGAFFRRGSLIEV